MYCPHCGFKNNPNNNFCKKCGFNLAKYRQSTLNSNNYNLQPTQQMQLINQRHHHGIIISIIIIILLIGLGIGAYKVEYESHSHSISAISQRSKENSSLSNSNENMKNQLGQLWANVQLSANGGNGSLAKYFTTGTKDFGYKQLHDWSNDQSKSNGLSRVILNPSIISIKSTGSVAGDKTATVKYKVNYKFEYNNGNNKKQAFIWNAHFQKENGKWLIATNNSNNKPVSND